MEKFRKQNLFRIENCMRYFSKIKITLSACFYLCSHFLPEKPKKFEN